MLTDQQVQDIVRQNRPKLKSYNNPNSGSSILRSKTYATPDEFLASINGNSESNEENQSTLGSIAGGVKDFAIGAGKGVLNTVKNSTSIISDNTPGIVKDALGSNPLNPLSTVSKLAPTVDQSIKPEYTQPTNTAQKAGFGTEQVGEFLLPSGVAGKAGKAAELAVGASKLGKIAGTAARLGAEGFIGAGQTAVQEGELNRKALGAGIASAGFSGAASSLSKFSEALPKTMWKGVLDRLSSSIAKNPNLEEEVSKLGMVGGRKALQLQAKNNIQVLETQIDDLLSNAEGKVDTKNLSGYLDNLTDAYSKVPGEENSVNTIQSLKNEILSRGEITAKEANDIKRGIYKVISDSYGKGTLEIPAKKEAQKLIARGLKEEIEKVVPEAKNLNARQGIFLQMDKALNRVLNQKSKGIAGTGIGLYDLTVGLGTGAAFGGPTGFAAVMGKKAYESPLIRTGVAKLANWFNNASPTKKALIYNALKGMTSKIVNSVQPTSE